MNDNQFDDFVNDKLRDHAAPVPAGLWEKVAEGQFDQFIGSKLRDAEAPVPDSTWDKITDAQFDHFIADKLSGHTAPVAGGLWDKITDGQFDQFVSGKLRDHASPVPDGLWEKVRPEEEDDKFGFIWFRYPAAAILILAILTAGAVGAYFYFNPSSSTNNKQTAGQQNNAVSAGKTRGEQDAVFNNPSTQAQDKKNTGTDQNNTQQPETNGIKITGSAQKTTQPVQVSANAEKAAGKVFDLKPAIPSANKNLANTDYNIFPPADATETRNNAVATTGDNDVTENAFDNYAYKQLLPGSTIATERNSYKGYQGLAALQLSNGNHTSKYRNIIICPSDKRGLNPDWYLETYVSPDIAFKSVSNVSATQQYLARKDSSEHMRIGYSAGIRLVKPITDNLLVKAGLQYSQVNERYVYRTENEVKTTTVVTERTIIRAPGDTVIVKDTSVLQTIGFRNNTVQNHYRSFDIPVTVGYEFGNEDLRFGINAGVVVNLSSWYQGVILDSSLGTVNLDKGGNMVYKSNIGLGLTGGISVVKRLSDDMHVFFEPYFRYNLSNMTTPQSSFNQRLSIGGLSVGLRFNLNRK